MGEQLHFSMDGEFLTAIARDWFWNMADIIWVVVFLCVLIASCFGMYYFQGENKQKFVFCFLLVALSFEVLAFRLLDIAYTVINAAIKAA